jgi:DNA-binding HxlR family transcriptional regulator
MRALEVLGRRWTLRILWELRGAPLNFRALRAACGDASPSSLAARLADLRALGAVTATDGGYALTPSGKRLAKLVLALHTWAEREL